MTFLLVSGVGLLFFGIVIAVFGASAFSEQRRIMARRLAPTQAAANRRQEFSITLEDGFLQRFERAVTPASEDERQQVSQRLIRAGYRKPSAMRIYYLSKALCVIGASVLAAFAIILVGQDLPYLLIAALIFSAAVFGNFLPSLWVERQIERRREAAELGFPDTLDMLLVCVEAGLGFDQACRRVSGQIASTCPVLAEELRMINDELLAGKERSAVFQDFAERTGVADIKAFTTVLRHSDEFGVSIAETLRVYAADMRHKRIMRAEEKANLMPVKVAMGSIAFTVPPTMIILSGPSLIILLRAFGLMH